MGEVNSDRDRQLRDIHRLHVCGFLLFRFLDGVTDTASKLVSCRLFLGDPSSQQPHANVYSERLSRNIKLNNNIVLKSVLIGQEY